MGKMGAIFAREYLERVRQKWFVFSTVFAPVFFGAIMFIPPMMARRSKASEDVSRIVILDASGSGLGERIQGALMVGNTGDTTRTQLRPVDAPALAQAESLAAREVRERRVVGYLVLDSSTMAGRTARYAGRNASTVSDIDELRRILRQSVMAERLERLGVDAAQSEALANMRVTLEAERLTERGRGGSALASIVFALVIAMLLYMSMMLYGQAVLRGVMEEKQTRVAEVVISSVSPGKLLAGKVLGVGAVGLTQLTIWVVSAILLIKYRAPILERLGASATNIPMPRISLDTAALLVLFFVCGYAFYAALFAAVGAMVNSEQEAQQALMPLVLILVSSMAFFQPILTKPTSGLAMALSLLPFSAPLVMPIRMSVIPVPAWEIAASVASVVLGTWVAVWVAARIYRTGMLMYGKRPTMRELARWVRQAG